MKVQSYSCYFPFTFLLRTWYGVGIELVRTHYEIFCITMREGGSTKPMIGQDTGELF
jgi:hypothetical protein